MQLKGDKSVLPLLPRTKRQLSETGEIRTRVLILAFIATILAHQKSVVNSFFAIFLYFASIPMYN